MAPSRKKSGEYRAKVKAMKTVLVNDPSGSRKYFQFEKFYVYEHLNLCDITPGGPDYAYSCEDTIYLITIYLLLIVYLDD